MSASDWWELELSLKMTLTDVILFLTYINYSKQKRHIEYHDKLGSHGITWTFVLFQHDCIQSKLHKDMDKELGLEELCAFGMNQSKVDSGRLVWPHNRLLEKWPKIPINLMESLPRRLLLKLYSYVCEARWVNTFSNVVYFSYIYFIKLGVENVLEQKSISNNAVVIKP